jgi:hypothetical protein
MRPRPRRWGPGKPARPSGTGDGAVLDAVYCGPLAGPSGGRARHDGRRGRTPNGLLIPPRFSFEHLFGSPRIALQRRLLLLPGAKSQDWAERFDDILALPAGTYRSAEGVEAYVPGAPTWRCGSWVSSGGQSASVAGRGALRRAANYHVSPAMVLEAAGRATGPSSGPPSSWAGRTSGPWRTSSQRTAHRPVTTGCPLWVRSIRTAKWAVEFPTPEEARAHAWSDEGRVLVVTSVGMRVTVPFRLGAGIPLTETMIVMLLETEQRHRGPLMAAATLREGAFPFPALARNIWAIRCGTQTVNVMHL